MGAGAVQRAKPIWAAAQPVAVYSRQEGIHAWQPSEGSPGSRTAVAAEEGIAVMIVRRAGNVSSKSSMCTFWVST